MISISPAALNLTQEEWTILEQLAVANNTSKEELISTAVKKFITSPQLKPASSPIAHQ